MICEFIDSWCCTNSWSGTDGSALFSSYEEWARINAPCRTYFWTPDTATPARDVPNRDCTPVPT